jgi:hypothetical protein
METVAENGGSFVHGGTFSHDSVACAAGLATVRILERDGLVERAARVGEQIGRRLKENAGGSPHVADIRGLGMMWGVEFVKDRQTLAPFPRAEKITERLYRALFEQGVILYKSVGMAGTDGDGLIVAPPFIITEEQIDLVVDKLRRAVDTILGS